MTNNPPRLTGKHVTLNGVPGTVIRWASQGGQPMVEVDWQDGTRSWVSYHSVHGEPAAPAKPQRRKN